MTAAALAAASLPDPAYLGSTALLFALFGGEGEVRKGSGRVVKEERHVPQFDEIEVRGVGLVELRQGPLRPLCLVGEDNMLFSVRTYVETGRLVIEAKRGLVLRPRRDIQVLVTVPRLRSVRLSGAATISSRGRLEAERVALELSGAGRLDLELSTTRIASRLSGSGRIELRGDADVQAVHLSGSGCVSAMGLSSRVAEAELSGSGNIRLKTSERLTAELSGTGTVRFDGSPCVRALISGTGSVSPA